MFKKGDKIWAILGERVRLCTFVSIAEDNNKYNILEIDGKQIFKQHYYCFKKELQAVEYLINKLGNSIFKLEERRQEIICEKLKK